MVYLKWSVTDQIGTISITKAPANALSTALLNELALVLDEAEKDEHVRVILIYGEGRFFSAGADIKEFTTIENGKQFSEIARLGQSLFERIESFTKPIIAAVHGAALGGGLELAMACQIRLVSENAKLGLPELQLGLIPGFAGSQRLPRLIGAPRAAEMLLTSVPITGEEAAKVGLANHAYPEAELLDQAYKIAGQIAKKSPIAVKAILELLSYTKSPEFHKGVEREAELFGRAFESLDGQEGISAFIEKREPKFIGK